MKKISTTFVVLSFVCAQAQQLTLNPQTAGQSMVVESVIHTSDASIVYVGLSGSSAMVCKQTMVGDVTWGRRFDAESQFLSGEVLPNGDIVAVGRSYSDALVARIDGSTGLVVWSKVLYLFGQNVTLRSVTIDGNDIYVVGDRQTGSIRHEVIAKLDQNGNIVWEKTLEGSSNIHMFRRVFVRNGKVFAFGQGIRFAQGFSMAVFNKTSGDIIGHKVFGGFGDFEVFIDATMVGENFILSYRNSNNPGSLVLAKIDQNMNFVGEPVTDFPAPWALGLSTIGTLSPASDGGFYVSGGGTQFGVQTSVIVKMDQNLSFVWGRRVTDSHPIQAVTREVGGKVSATFSFGLADRVVTTFFESDNGYIEGEDVDYCYVVYSFNIDFIPVWTAELVQIRTPSDIDLLLWEIGNSSYRPNGASCFLVPLPITLVSFTATGYDEVVHLHWQTASEKASDYFRVLRSSDMSSWEYIGMVPAAGQSNALLSYGLVDDDPMSGVNYYKLIEVDHLGVETDHGVVSVWFSQAEKYRLYPNPARVGETISLGNTAENLLVSDELGRFVPFDRPDQGSLVIRQTGVYLVTIISEHSRSVHKVVVH